jgi:hypothetical protein
MTPNLITSQHYVNKDIVAEKIAAEDFEVAVSPEFEIGGQTFRLVLDGHHSLAAAIEAGVEPEIVELTAREHDAIGWLENGDVETFLDATHMDGEYIYAVSGAVVWG